MNNESTPNENIVLIGFMGSGKSSVGKQIAKKLGYQFADTDTLIVQKTGMSITEIFAAQGEEAFRNLETQALKSLRGENGLVIATGGGIVIREANLPLLRALGLVVWLNASEEVIFERVSRNKNRPLLHTDNPRETIHNLLSMRVPLYERAAQVTIDTSTSSHDQIVTKVIEAARSKTRVIPTEAE